MMFNHKNQAIANILGRPVPLVLMRADVLTNMDILPRSDADVERFRQLIFENLPETTYVEKEAWQEFFRNTSRFLEAILGRDLTPIEMSEAYDAMSATWDEFIWTWNPTTGPHPIDPESMKKG